MTVLVVNFKHCTVGKDTKLSNKMTMVSDTVIIVKRFFRNVAV